MQDAATVLDVIGKRGARGLPVERLYRQLFNPQLFLMAYGKLYSNRGAMTPGVTGETVDGMSLAKIGAIIGALRAERYRWQPVKRVYIEKKNSSKKRPLGLPTWSDKLVAEVVRLLLEAYYEPQFSDRSHGFRPRPGLPHRAQRGSGRLEGDALVHRGGHLRLLRVAGPRGHARGPGGEDPRWPVPATDQPDAQGGLPGGLDVACDAQRLAAGRDRLARPQQHLP